MNKLTQQGLDSYKAGDPVAARFYLKQALQQDRLDIQAWLWLSAAVEDSDDKAFCLRTVLRLDPGNETALRGLARLESGQEPEESLTTPEAALTPKEAPTGQAAQPGPEPGGYVPPFIFSEEELAAFEPFLNELETGTVGETGLEKSEAEPVAKPETKPEVESVQDLRATFSEYLSPLPAISIEEEQPEPESARPATQARKTHPKPAAKSALTLWMWVVLGILLLLIISVTLAFIMLVIQGR